jgi:hypothetical protein
LIALVIAGGVVYWRKPGLPTVVQNQVDKVQEAIQEDSDPFGPGRVTTARPVHFQCPEPNLSPTKKNQRKFPPLVGIAGMSLESSASRR